MIQRKILSRGKELVLILDEGSVYQHVRINIVWSKGLTHPYCQLLPTLKMLARELMQAPKGLYVDHINKNTMDNRRENLRLVTPAQNTWNRKLQGGKIPNTSGYRGICRIKKTGKWWAGLSHENKMINLFAFETPEQAARAYDQRCRELRGSFAITNFPESQ